MEENAVLPYKLISSLLTMSHFQLSCHGKTTACITNGSAKEKTEKTGLFTTPDAWGSAKPLNTKTIRHWPLNFLSPQRHIIVVKSNCFLSSIKNNVGYILAPSIPLCREITLAGQWHSSASNWSQVNNHYPLSCGQTLLCQWNTQSL